MHTPTNSFNTLSTLEANGKTYRYFALQGGEFAGHPAARRLPVSSRILLENLLRHEDGVSVTRQHIEALASSGGRAVDQEILFHPARVLMQDFTGVPAVADLAAMRDALASRGADPLRVNPLTQVDLVIDHSVNVDSFGSAAAFDINVRLEMQRNHERYRFLKWAQGAFANFRVVPPGTGICHQVNLEYLAKVVWQQPGADAPLAFPDTLVGTDSHTTMINALGVLGWGVGGIEAEAAMLGQPVPMLIPEVVGFELTGALAPGITATDLVLQVVQMLRAFGVVGKFVEFYGAGLDHLPLPERATLANMAPEYGATCGFFPVDAQTLHYLAATGRDAETCALVEAYCRAQGLWRDAHSAAPDYAATLSLDLSTVQPSLAGPRRPQDRVPLPALREATEAVITQNGKAAELDTAFALPGDAGSLHHGDVVIAAITSCTNTSNPAVMIGAGLLARNALTRGLQRKPWVKSSLAPGSRVVSDYLAQSGLQTHLDALGFNLVGYGCTTCIGNSGPLPAPVEEAVSRHQLVVSAVLSGNRNFEGRIHPQVKANWLASPPLVVAYALAGTTRIDLSREPLGVDPDGAPVFLKELWPSDAEIAQWVHAIGRQMFTGRYRAVFDGDAAWQAIKADAGANFAFAPDSTYIRLPPFFEPRWRGNSGDIVGAPILSLLGDSVTTDHISPAGQIPPDSPAAHYLRSQGVSDADFNSYGARRGNHEVMMRGTFGNIRLRNALTPGIEGGYTVLHAKGGGNGARVFIYDAAMAYQRGGVATVVVAGKEYGTGSSRDWAAKGTLLLGVRAVIAESFERIHRSNLVGMGVLPLEFLPGDDRTTLSLDAGVTFDILGIDANLQPQQLLVARLHYAGGATRDIQLRARLDTRMEVDYFQSGGVLNFILEQFSGEPPARA